MAKKNTDYFADPGVTGLENVTVRELNPGDLEAVVRVDNRVSGRPRREYFQKKIAEATRETGIRISLLAEVDGCVAGFLLGRLYYGEFGLPEPTAIVDSIGVDPDFKGRHVGSALLKQLEANMRAIGIECIQTQVEWRQTGLLGFLGAAGFSPIPTLTLEKRVRDRAP
jgi:ribosomal protein S18 acetylase RimI-like enzyme